MKLFRIRIAAVILAALSPPAHAQALINGAGATFPFPIYARWFDEYHRLRPDALINYQSVGSRAGMRQLQAGVLDLGASDMPLSDADAADFPNGLLHFPTVVGAVVPVYNVPGVSKELNFSAEALSGIFMGRIAKWNDPEMVKANPGVGLPGTAIVVVHRSDGSGTTYILADFLTKASPKWKDAVGRGTSLRWRTGIGAKGNEGVAGIVHQTPFSFGYVELIYAEQNRMTYGRVRNPAGRFVKAGMAGMKSAATATTGGGTWNPRGETEPVATVTVAVIG
ncbi:MAG: phosphate ABC transporter substrate-binding protein PstS, partial [Acidobacteriia bacterium]|nr:phosphate ABC transporter substrate-binding protein PstS [Terriglobia bacterium]